MNALGLPGFNKVFDLYMLKRQETDAGVLTPMWGPLRGMRIYFFKQTLCLGNGHHA